MLITERYSKFGLKVGPEWRGTDDYVFATAWGEPIHPDTVSSLMTVLINAHNDPQAGEHHRACWDLCAEVSLNRTCCNAP